MVKKIGIDGGKELAEKFKSIGKQVYTQQEQAVMQAGMLVERDAKINVRVDTGRLQNSIATRLAESDESVIASEVGTNVKYAKVVEYKYPYLYPAYENNKQKILKMLAKAFKEGCGL
jgi:excinuclease UvrABC helicase subunit UvrB